MFGWWTSYPTEGYPRGQASATLMVSEIGRGGDWLRALQAPFMDKFTAPTVEGVDFPAMGLFQAWNDASSGTLNVGTYAASGDKRGGATSFRVTNLPNASAVRITVDGQPFTRFAVTSPNSIRIDTTIDLRRFQIVTGYRGAARVADAAGSDAPSRVDTDGAGFRRTSDGLTVASGFSRTSRPKGSSGFSRTTVGCGCCA
jgi:hypothetical protein